MAFDRLKEALISAPIVVSPDYEDNGDQNNQIYGVLKFWKHATFASSLNPFHATRSKSQVIYITNNSCIMDNILAINKVDM